LLISSASNEGENSFEGSWNLIDANTEMDDQTANQLLNNLQNNYWHGKSLFEVFYQIYLFF
jgi:hypothetical protein